MAHHRYVHHHIPHKQLTHSSQSGSNSVKGSDCGHNLTKIPHAPCDSIRVLETSSSGNYSGHQCLKLVSILLLITSSYLSSGVLGDSSFKGILPFLQSGNDSTRVKVQRQVTSQVELLLWQVDKLRQLKYFQACDSIASEKARHELTDLVANVTQNPSEQLFKDIDSKHEAIIKSGKLMCDYSRGLSCAESRKCICYNGQRHDITYETVRETGSCKLDEMSRCYSPSYLVSKGAVIIHCINGAKCVVSGLYSGPISIIT